MKKFKNYGFTLSEVLITLAIIGIVAAITVPTIMANYTKQAKSAKLKKAASVVSQACKKALADNGTGDIRNTDLYEIANLPNVVTEQEATNVLGKYFNISGAAKTVQADFPFQKTSGGNALRGRHYVNLADGMTISQLTFGQDNYYGPGRDGLLSFVVDIDGMYKGYNLADEDTFLIELKNDCSLNLNCDSNFLTNNGHFTTPDISAGIIGFMSCVSPWISDINRACAYTSDDGHFMNTSEPCFQAIANNNWDLDYKRNTNGYIKNYYNYYMENNGGN